MNENNKYVRRFYKEILVKDNRNLIIGIMILAVFQVVVSLTYSACSNDERY